MNCKEIAERIIRYVDGDDCQTCTEGHRFAEMLLSKNPEFLAMVKSQVAEIFTFKLHQICDKHEVH